MTAGPSWIPQHLLDRSSTRSSTFALDFTLMVGLGHYLPLHMQFFGCHVTKCCFKRGLNITWQSETKASLVHCVIFFWQCWFCKHPFLRNKHFILFKALFQIRTNAVWFCRLGGWAGIGRRTSCVRSLPVKAADESFVWIAASMLLFFYFGILSSPSSFSCVRSNPSRCDYYVTVLWRELHIFWAILVWGFHI